MRIKSSKLLVLISRRHYIKLYFLCARTEGISPCFPPTGGNLNKLLEFSTELKDLLRLHPAFKLSVSSLISEYQTHYDKKEPFSPFVYGFSSVTDLLEALPSVIEVTISLNYIFFIIGFLSQVFLVPSFILWSVL